MCYSNKQNSSSPSLSYRMHVHTHTHRHTDGQTGTHYPTPSPTTVTQGTTAHTTAIHQTSHHTHLELLGEVEGDNDCKRGEERSKEHTHIADLNGHIQEVEDVVEQGGGDH